jgi:hypothetical protein
MARAAAPPGQDVIAKPDGERHRGPLIRAWREWTRIARRIGDFQARAILTAFYFVPLAPFALAVKWRGDPMAIKARTPKGWRPVEDQRPSEAATRQF